MNKRLIGLCFSIIGFVMALTGIFIDKSGSPFEWLDLIRYGGIVLLMVGAIVSYRATGTYVLYFNESTWKGNPTHNIDITYLKHGKKSPIAEVSNKNPDGSYSKAGVGISVSKKNNVKLSANIKFEGKVVIK